MYNFVNQFGDVRAGVHEMDTSKKNIDSKLVVYFI